MSDMREQREVVAWLGTHEPKYVLWRPSFKVFDGVPNVVRVPELFTYVVGHYQFHRTFDGFDLLIRKADRTDLPLGPEERNYWTTSLGQELNLRALPAISSIRDNARCEPGTVVFCEPVIRVLLNHDPDSAIPKNIDMEIDGATYRVAFTTMAKQREYFIKFSSLWFVAKTPVSQWRVTCPTGSSDCEAVGIEFRHFPNPKLY
jgi:hypothetical protein